MAEQMTVQVPHASKKNDTIATLIGLGQAIAVSMGDFFVHQGPNGLNWKTPTFWLGLGIAALAGAQGFYSNRGTQTQVVAQPVGQNPTVQVDVKQPE